MKYVLRHVREKKVLVVFCKNLSGIVLFFVIGMSKLAIFVGQILNYIIEIVLGRREYSLCPEM